MEIKAVKTMRAIRDHISHDISGMNWKQEHEYLNNQLKTLAPLAQRIATRPRSPAHL